MGLFRLCIVDVLRPRIFQNVGLICKRLHKSPFGRREASPFVNIGQGQFKKGQSDTRWNRAQRILLLSGGSWSIWNHSVY